jgi:plastocyanin
MIVPSATVADGRITFAESSMNNQAAGRAGVPTWARLLVVVGALVLATAAVAITFTGGGPGALRIGMMGGSGGAAGGTRGGMTGGVPSGAGRAADLQPGTAGFVAGTAAVPRVIRVTAGPGYAFSPSSIAIARGETVTFQVTTMGPLVHEFKVGPADAVAADAPGAAEVADIGMMQTKSLTYTFDGAGPFAYACHAAGHFEAGMRGTITVVG